MLVKADGIIEKANRLQEGEVEFIVSTNAMDSYGERINVEGINLTEFKKNPVVLWGHDGFNLPIAKATKIWKDGDKLMARAKFYLKDEFARKVYEYILDGYLNAVSIGGMVTEWASDGSTIDKMMMKEFSVVSVPANPEAMVVSKSLDTSQQAELKALGIKYARSILEKADGTNELQKNIESLQTLVATLREVAIGQTQEASAQTITKRIVLKQAQVVVQQAETVIRVIKLKEN